jgi:flagellar basal-body rod modification protein FlgD
MTVDAIASAGAATTPGLSRASLTDNFDTFLKLLTSQLQNQDPLSPLDSNAFTEQLVQFSQVEQQIRTNEQLEALNAQSRTASAGTALSYLGREAIIEDKRGLLSDDGAVWSYAFDADAESVELQVHDSAGRTVFTARGDKGAGGHGFSWDGRTNAGARAENGVYTLNVVAKNADDDAVAATITTRLQIMGIDLSSQTPSVMTIAGAHELSTIRAILDN